jgi:endonuclease/exonuclease/phosphatase family metal-dependent hydrolase
MTEPDVSRSSDRPAWSTVLCQALATTLVLATILVGAAWTIFVFQAFGDRGWLTAAVCLALGLTSAVLRWRLMGRAETGFRRRLLVRTGQLVSAILLVWLGLIAWSWASPGGPPPPPKQDARLIRILSWNILHGREAGPPWRTDQWSARKPALREAVLSTRPDILCVQEALAAQLTFLDGHLPGHDRVGVGRDDGRSGGEHCTIFFDGGRFQLLDSGTFWLEAPTDRPPIGFRIGPKRICTWARLRDRRLESVLRVYNTHLYLTEPAQLESGRLILGRIDAGDPGDLIVVAGDFNAKPDSATRRLFASAGLDPSTSRTGRKVLPTYQFYGLRLSALDEIFVGPGGRAMSCRILDMKPGNTFPSDHFGIVTDIDPDVRDTAPRLGGSISRPGRSTLIQISHPGEQGDRRPLGVRQSDLAVSLHGDFDRSGEFDAKRPESCDFTLQIVDPKDEPHARPRPLHGTRLDGDPARSGLQERESAREVHQGDPEAEHVPIPGPEAFPVGRPEFDHEELWGRRLDSHRGVPHHAREVEPIADRPVRESDQRSSGIGRPSYTTWIGRPSGVVCVVLSGMPSRS